MNEDRSKTVWDKRRIVPKHYERVEIRLRNGKAVRIHYDENNRQIKEEDAEQAE